MRRGNCRQPHHRQQKPPNLGSRNASIVGIMVLLSVGSVWGTRICRCAAAFVVERPATAASLLRRSQRYRRIGSRLSMRAMSNLSATSTSLESPHPSAPSRSSANAAVELAHVEFGNGQNVDGATESPSATPPVLLLHGLLGNKRNFATIGTSLSRQLDRKRRLFGLDLRNHGTSPSPS
jgi:hypothetical protein